MGAWMAGFGSIAGSILEKSVHIQKLNSLFSADIALMKSGNVALNQGVATRTLVAGMKSAILTGMNGGKLSDNLISSIGTTLALSVSKELPFIDKLNAQLSSVLISATITSALTKTKFVDNAASIGLSTFVQTAASSFGNQLAESKARKEAMAANEANAKMGITPMTTAGMLRSKALASGPAIAAHNQNPAPNPVPHSNVSANQKAAKDSMDVRGMSNTGGVKANHHQSKGVPLLAAAKKENDDKQRHYHTPNILSKKSADEAARKFFAEPAQGITSPNSGGIKANAEKVMMAVANHLIPAVEASPVDINSAKRPKSPSNLGNNKKDDFFPITARFNNSLNTFVKERNESTALKYNDDVQNPLTFKLQDKPPRTAYDNAAERLFLNQTSINMMSTVKVPVWNPSRAIVQPNYTDCNLALTRNREAFKPLKDAFNWGGMALRSTYEELSGNVSPEIYQWRANNRNNYPMAAQYSDEIMENAGYTNAGAQQALLTLGRGMNQFSLELSEKLGTVPKGAAAKYTDYINREAYLYSLTPTANSIPGKISLNVTNFALFFLPVGMTYTGARGILWTAGAAGAIQALYPTQDGQFSTRFAGALDTASITGLAAIGGSYLPSALNFVKPMYNRVMNLFGRPNIVMQTSPKIILDAGLGARVNALAGRFESPIINTQGRVEGSSLTMQWNQIRNNSNGFNLKLMPNYVARNRIQHESLKTRYRQMMEKPRIGDENLKKIIEKLYRDKAEIGSGSTADAVRYELATGRPVKGKMHVQKSIEYIKRLERWLEANPNSSLVDRAAAENVLIDLKDAIGEKPWYSKTIVPN